MDDTIQKNTFCGGVFIFLATRVPCNNFPILWMLRFTLFHIFIILEIGMYLKINGGVISTFQSVSFLVVHKILVCLLMSGISDAMKYDVLLFWEC